jgi:hypothetical protein
MTHIVYSYTHAGDQNVEERTGWLLRCCQRARSGRRECSILQQEVPRRQLHQQAFQEALEDVPNSAEISQCEFAQSFQAQAGMVLFDMITASTQQEIFFHND